jgi:DedD protein
MRLPFSRSTDAPPASGPDAVQAARTRARRRLIGALVLLAIGVMVFPLLFETQPRPIAVDTPIIARSSDVAPGPRSAPTTRPVPPPDAGTETPRPAANATAGVAASAAIAEAKAPSEASTPATTSARAPTPASGPAATPASTPAAPAARVAADARAPEPAAARPRAEDKSASAAPTAPASAAEASGRFVVQVGAYSDATTLREARLRVERLGLKTYTQVIEGDGGKRTRVRVGPFASREEAAAAAGKLKGAGLPANILAL